MLFAEGAFDPKLLTEVTATAAMIWVIWFTLSRSVPSIIKDFREDAAAARAQYVESTQIAREMFATELSDSRRDFREEMKAERAHCMEELVRFDHQARGYQQILQSQHDMNKHGVPFMHVDPSKADV